jgi:copper resistance protein B
MNVTAATRGDKAMETTTMRNSGRLATVVALLALAGQPVWAEETMQPMPGMGAHAMHDMAHEAMPEMGRRAMQDAGTMPGMDHAATQVAGETANSPAGMEGMAHDSMPGMDHGNMQQQGAMPEMEPAGAMDQGAGAMPGMSAMDHGSMQAAAPPADARDPHAYSGGYTLESGPYAMPGPRQLRLADEQNFGALLVDRLEAVRTSDNTAAAYDLQAWFGRDYDRAVLRAEGHYDNGTIEEASTELLWGHAVATFWDTLVGLRHDSGEEPDRSWLAFGVQGLAPYWFEVGATGYIGEEGHSALNLNAEYDLLFTQRLILQPRIEANFYGKDDAERGIGSGLSELAAGLRLRYEIRREFAPYIGVEWVGKYGGTADFARDAGLDTSETVTVAGVRFWF